MTSPLVARPRRARVAALATALLATALSPLAAAGPASADHAGAEPGPVHAGNTYGWWDKGVSWREEFEQPYSGPTGSQWRASGSGEVVHQNGMLTLNTTTSGSLSARLGFEGSEVGRWETRLRSRQYGRGGGRYKVVAALVPAGDRDQHCGAQDIALESYRIGSSKVNLYARSLPDVAWRGSRDGMDLGRDRWHTYAVEVTRDRISWFVDAHVVQTERRPEVWSGVPLVPQFTMQAAPGRAMNVSRMQMDWIRHWSLEAPDDLSVDAPPTRPGRYGKAC
jgi:hypothetical protein